MDRNLWLKRTAVLLVLCLFLSCSAVTRYTLFLDAASFFTSEEKSLRLIVLEGIGLSLYILPSIYPDLDGSGPDEDSQRGLEYSYSALQIPEGGELTFRLEISELVTNLDAAKTLPFIIIELYGASPEAENLYVDGTLLNSIGFSTIGPGETVSLTMITELAEGDPGFEHIKNGHIRVGFYIRFEPAVVSGDIEIQYELETIEMEVGVRPFGLLP